MIDFALALAKDAGRVLLTHFGKVRSGAVGYKGRVDLVTAADLEAEEVVVSAIRTRFPEHGVVAEERLPETGSPEHRWIVDPLDGTTNFVHGYPFFCVSIALEIAGEPHLGVVHAPLLDETYHAVRGEGAFLDGRPVRVSETDELIRSLLATGFPYDRWRLERNNLAEFCELTMATQGVRRSGSAALDLAGVASGRLDGFWEFALKPWDVAAGSVLVREAGGDVTDLKGGRDYRDGAEIVATNGRIHAALLAALGRVSGDPPSSGYSR